MSAEKIKVLLEMRPAFDGFAGIPQETRLLFRGLCMLEDIEVKGMMQTSHQFLARGTSQGGWRSKQLSDAQKINRYSRVIISTTEKANQSVLGYLLDYLSRQIKSTRFFLSALIGISPKIRLTNFETEHFKDFVWRTIFAKTLPSSDFDLVTARNFKVCSVPWNVMHNLGLASLSFFRSPIYPKLDTTDAAIFVSQTPYPARISRTSILVVRYHDALPIFMPHTIPDKSFHQAIHYYGLMSCVKQNAYFACVSDATRSDLLKIFPQVSDRAVTIHNMVSQNYFLEDSLADRVTGIIRARLNEQSKWLPEFLTNREKESFYSRHLNSSGFKFLLIVSTIEPRKNHLRLLAAWEVIKASIDPSLKLVVVGALGWDNSALARAFKPWIEKGQLFMLNSVPAAELRVLYRHATATVCPSLGEGFDFSGIESMRSGGIVIASDIPVHREIYSDAAEYFESYSTVSLVKALNKVMYDPEAQQAQERMRTQGQVVSSRYLPEKILPQWDRFLKRIAQ